MLLPDSLPGNCRAAGHRRRQGQEESNGGAKVNQDGGCFSPSLLEITPEVGRLQADTQKNEITLTTASYVLVGLLPTLQGECLLCVHGDCCGRV